MNQALIIVDMQNDFVHPDGAEPILDTKRNPLISNIVQLLSWAREKRILVIFTQDTHSEDQDFEARGMIKHGIKNSWGWKVIKDLCHTRAKKQKILFTQKTATNSVRGR